MLDAPRAASRRSRDWLCALALLALLSCGRTAGQAGVADAGSSDGGSGAATGSDGSSAGGTGGAPAAAGGKAGATSSDPGGATGQGGAAGGTAGAAGTTDRPTADVSGRWGLFVFEDPVGVFLQQEADGTITGQGCTSGAPGELPTTEGAGPGGCSALSGRVSGQSASFGFPTSATQFAYQANVVISADGQRMTGTLTTFANIPYPVAWRRVREGAAWLDRGDFMRPDPMDGPYELTLIPEESIGNEFVAGTPYWIRYQEHTILGQLGSFWTDEISPVGMGSPLRVGPVSATVPELPDSLSLDFDATGFTGVTAITPSGGHYRFAITKASH